MAIIFFSIFNLVLPGFVTARSLFSLDIPCSDAVPHARAEQDCLLIHCLGTGCWMV